MHGQVVFERRRGCYGIVFVLFLKLLKPVVSFGVDHGAVFNPADLVFLRLDPEKTPAVLQHLERLPVDHLAYAIGDGRDAVMQVGLAN